MRYMGDFPTKQSPVELARFVVSKGLSRPLVRDEIFCQLVKQITGNSNRKL